MSPLRKRSFRKFATFRHLYIQDNQTVDFFIRAFVAKFDFSEWTQYLITFINEYIQKTKFKKTRLSPIQKQTFRKIMIIQLILSNITFRSGLKNQTLQIRKLRTHLSFFLIDLHKIRMYFCDINFISFNLNFNVMKKLILSSILLMSVIFSYAYNFNVYGYITDDDGNPVANQEVILRVGNGNNGISVYTVDAGYYTANLELEGTQSILVQVYSWNCEELYTEVITASGEGSEQADFEICSEGNSSDCFAFYFYERAYDNSLLVNFTAFVEPFDENTTYFWDFGDGSTGTEATPYHEYSEEGEYTVSMTVTNDECGEMIYEDVVYISNENFGRCLADFYFGLDTTVTTTVYFTDMSWSMDDITGWDWNFGDGNTSNEQNPTHTYDEDGEYTVDLSITTPTCTSSVAYTIQTGDSTWYPDECQALFFTQYNWDDYFNVSFVDMSWGSGNGNINAWQWNFGDGNGSSDQNPTHTYSEEGQYNVELTIFTDSCTSTFQEIVYIENWDNGCGLNAFFFPEFDSLTTNIQFYDLSIPEPTYWNWSFGDGATSTQENPLHEYAETGIYLVSLTSGFGDCESTFEMEIELREFDGDVKEILYEGVIRQAYAVHEGTTDIKNPTKTVSQYSVFPNPVTNELNINFNSAIDAKISIINITGQEIKRLELSDKNTLQADVSNLPAGVYFARINAGTQTQTVKFIKK